MRPPSLTELDRLLNETLPLGVSRDGDELWGSSQIVDWTGVTYRQLDYWIRSGLVIAVNPEPGSGVPRLYTTEQVRKVWLTVKLLSYGISLQIIRQLGPMETARRIHEELSEIVSVRT